MAEQQVILFILSVALVCAAIWLPYRGAIWLFRRITSADADEAATAIQMGAVYALYSAFGGAAAFLLTQSVLFAAIAFVAGIALGFAVFGRT